MEQRLCTGMEMSRAWQLWVPGGEMQLLIRSDAFRSDPKSQMAAPAPAAAAGSFSCTVGFAACVEWRKIDQNRG